MQDFFYVRVNGCYEQIYIPEIIYVESRNKFIHIVTDEKVKVVMSSLVLIRQYLSKEHFCQVHRTYIVALNRIRRFDRKHLYLKDHVIPLARNRRKDLMGSVQFLKLHAPARSIF